MIGAIVWQRPHLLWLAILLFALSAAAWLLFDRLTTRTLGQRLRFTLFIFRMLALTLIAASLLRPTIRLREPSARRGIVAVLVDQSASMSVIDPGRSRAELVPLAVAVGAIDAHRRDQKLIALSEAISAIEPAADEFSRVGGELEYARLTQRSIEPAATRVREAQHQLDARLGEAERLAAALPPATSLVPTLKTLRVSSATTRPETTTASVRSAISAAGQLLLQSDSQLDQHDPAVHEAVDHLLDRTRLELVQRCLQSAMPKLSQQFTPRVFGFGSTLGNEMNPAALTAALPGSDLFAAVRELRHRLAGERLSAMIICSDGHQTEPLAGDPLNTADLPIYAINPAADPSTDLAIQQLTLPRSVFAGAPASAAVTISNSPPASRTVNLTLASEATHHSEPVHLSGPTTRVTIPFTAKAPGPMPVDALLDAEPRESTLLNNSLRSWTRVNNQPLHIALLRSNDTANTRSLQAALQNDASVTLTTPTLNPDADLSDTILDQDLVVLADVPYARLSDTTWLTIQRFVRERGGAVMIVSASPGVYLDYAQHDASLPLLAWSADPSPTLRIWPGASPTFRPVAANAEALVSLPLADESDVNRQLWRDLPLLFHVLNFPSLSATAQPLMVEAQTRSPLLAMQWLGFGRTLLVGTDEFYRWNTPLLSPKLIWTRLFDQATGGAYAIDDGLLALDINSLTPQPGQTVRVRTRVRAGSRIESDETFDPPLLLVERDGHRYFSQLLAAPTDPFPNRTEVPLPNLPAGAYRIMLLWADRKITLPIQVADSFTRELSNVAGDPSTLAALVGPRGAVLPLEELPGLSSRIEAATDPSPAFVNYGLWDSPYLFLLIVGCFGVDWAIRQHAGLA